MSNPQRRHTVSESADKITLKTKLKRGTGTRDEDRFTAKVKGDDPGAVAADMRALIEALRDEGLAAAVRETQPGADR